MLCWVQRLPSSAERARSTFIELRNEAKRSQSNMIKLELMSVVDLEEETFSISADMRHKNTK